MFYLYNPDTDLYYLLTASVDVDTGSITTSIEQSGISYNPGWVPASGETFIPIEFYLTYFNLDTSAVDGNQYNTVSMGVTKFIERYTCNSWVGISVPEDLMMIGSLMIRDKINEAKTFIDSRLASESVTNYSYSIGSNAVNTRVYSKYIEDLDAFRIVPFA